MISGNQQIDLSNISEEELLNVRICNLPLTIKGTWVEDCVHQLYRELETHDIAFKPVCYLADEWLTPTGETCIGIPFYLAHPTLTQMEKKLMLEAEGSTKSWAMQLLRHEAGHALMHAYQLNKRKSWRQLFGSSNVEYDDHYRYQPYSKNYVRHLDGFYAQFHPEEDFVETFAVWLTPDFDWRNRYKGWKALKKLEYVEHVVKTIKDKSPLLNSQRKYWRLSTLRITLRNYYKKKKNYAAEDIPDFHDAFLKSVFLSASEASSKSIYAIEVIRKHRYQILTHVSRYSGERKYLINELLRGLQKRTRELKLKVEEDDLSSVLPLAVYVATLIMHYMYTGRYRGTNTRKYSRVIEKRVILDK